MALAPVDLLLQMPLTDAELAELKKAFSIEPSQESQGSQGSYHMLINIPFEIWEQVKDYIAKEFPHADASIRR